MRFHLLNALAFVCASALGADVKGSLVFDTVLPDISHAPVSSRVLLDYGENTALIRQDGSFVLPNVSDGKHILTTIVPGYVIFPLLLTVQSDTIHVQIHQPAKEALPTTATSLPYPITLQARGKEDFFVKVAAFNPLGMLKNPMVLMMLVTGIMMFGLPKLTAYLESDPEMAREMAEQRKKMSNYQNMDWSGSLSNMLAGSEATSHTPNKDSSGVKKRKGK